RLAANTILTVRFRLQSPIYWELLLAHWRTIEFVRHHLNWFGQDGVVSQLSSIQYGCTRLQQCRVNDFNISEGRSDSGHKIENNPGGFHLDSARFNPLFQFRFGAVVWKVGEEYFGHYGVSLNAQSVESSSRCCAVLERGASSLEPLYEYSIFR